jgi:hypothetical protein
LATLGLSADASENYHVKLGVQGGGCRRGDRATRAAGRCTYVGIFRKKSMLFSLLSSFIVSWSLSAVGLMLPGKNGELQTRLQTDVT